MKRYGAQGLSMLEIILVVVIVSIIAAALIAVFRVPSSTLYARDAEAAIRQGRFEAIKRDQAVALVWTNDGGTARLSTRVNNSSNASCALADTEELQAATFDNYGLLSIKFEDNGTPVDVFASSEYGLFLWLPNGRTRGCSGGSSASQMTVSNNRKTVTIKITATGEVELGSP